MQLNKKNYLFIYFFKREIGFIGGPLLKIKFVKPVLIKIVFVILE